MSDPIYSSATSKSDSDKPAIPAILERIDKTVKTISRDFKGWNDSSTRGPGLYFVIVQDSISEFSVPMGTNRWPAEDCSSVLAETDTFRETAQNVAFSHDGAVVVDRDGAIQETMVRVNQRSPAKSRQLDDFPYAEWMGARHMSALETSTRQEVIAAITLSEEGGRVTVFTDGTFEESNAKSLMVD